MSSVSNQRRKEERSQYSMIERVESCVSGRLFLIVVLRNRETPVTPAFISGVGKVKVFLRVET